MQDNGYGVAEGIKSQIFEPFFTTKPAGEGTGLGLSVSYRLIAEIGGALTLTDSAEGARFEISLPGTTMPLEKGPAVVAKPVQTTLTETSAVFSRILVVDDESLLAGFEDCTLPEPQWNHQAHIRVAYLYLRRHPFDEALERMRASLKRYNAARNVPDIPHRGYHETLTVAWLTLVASVMKHHGVGQDSLDFCREQPFLLNRFLLRLYYTRRTIMSPAAKRAFLPPDIAPLPS